MRQANMNKENSNAAEVEEPTARITRARLKALGNQGGVFPTSKPSFKQDQKRVLRSKAKRAAADENKAPLAAISGLQCKRRAVLKDVSNISNENLKANCSNAADLRTSEQDLNSSRKNVEVADAPMETTQIEEDPKTKLAEELSKIKVVENHEMASPENVEGEKQTIYDDIREDPAEDPMVASIEQAGFRGLQKKEERKKCGKSDASSSMSVVDIDSNLEDSHVCSLYAPDIFENIRVTELGQRPSTNYMERLQQDITSSMRGILIDWLVEVSEEYKLVPDTLYLTVNLIDRFLSHNHIEKQRLQLLGVTCMLIASKYEEICAPRVEEFCFITDNTYTRGEVLKMESQVLNFLYFRLTVPTTKTFLRRFIQAAQASYKVPCVELEFLANYLAELTLPEYNFLKFLPSIIAASAVFLARWTLNQSDHPWNPTLEHYTRYKVSELETTVIALEELQLNSSGCALNAIREKYRQQKFKCVANLTSQQRVLTLFER